MIVFRCGWNPKILPTIPVKDAPDTDDGAARRMCLCLCADWIHGHCAVQKVGHHIARCNECQKHTHTHRHATVRFLPARPTYIFHSIVPVAMHIAHRVSRAHTHTYFARVLVQNSIVFRTLSSSSRLLYGVACSRKLVYVLVCALSSVVVVCAPLTRRWRALHNRHRVNT